MDTPTQNEPDQNQIEKWNKCKAPRQMIELSLNLIS